MISVDSNWSAVLTPPGGAAIGIVRLSGADALGILMKVFHPSKQVPQGGAVYPDSGLLRSLFTGGRLRFGRLLSNGEVIDDAVVGQAPSLDPPAFDIFAHGGVRVVERVLEKLEEHGAPLRNDSGGPQAVFRSGNLIEREAIDALCQARTERAVRFLAWQRQRLPKAVETAAGLCTTDPVRAEPALRAMVSGFEMARLLLGGATIALIGPTNAGKSTLFNRLAGRPAAIVSERAGTTRDWVTASVEMDGIPVTLIDTAGQRLNNGTVEDEAIRSGWRMAQHADLTVFVLDGAQPLPLEAAQVSRVCASLPHRLIVLNKIDLPQHRQQQSTEGARGAPEATWIRVSARTGAGMSDLLRNILAALGCVDLSQTAPCLFTERQQRIAQEAVSDLLNRPVRAELLLRDGLIGR